MSEMDGSDHFVSPSERQVESEQSDSSSVDEPAAPSTAKSDARSDGVEACEIEVDKEEEEEEEEEEDEGDFLEGWPDDTEELELVHMRLNALAHLNLSRFAGHLKKLCLRQNYISYLNPEIFTQLTRLEELDVYDNKLRTIGDALNESYNVKILDLSFNLFKSIPDTLHNLASLQTIYFVQNSIRKISGFERVTTLRSLELGGNRIRKIENLDALVNLEELWLGKNKITKLENLGSLKRLKILALQSNRITKLEGLEGLENLEDLHVSHNGIEKIEGLERNLKLKTLDLGNNFVTKLENVSHLAALEELWINNNKIQDFEALEPQLGHISTLTTLYLEGNPCEVVDRTAYRRKVMLALPKLQQIDAVYARQAVFLAT